MTFSLSLTSCLLRLPTDTALRTANWPRLNMTNHMTRHRRSAMYGAGKMRAYFICITHISFQWCNCRSTIDIRRCPRQHFFENTSTGLTPSLSSQCICTPCNCIRLRQSVLGFGCFPVVLGIDLPQVECERKRGTKSRDASES